MTGYADSLVRLDFFDAEALWEAWAPAGEEDILARAAFERLLRSAAGLEDEALYFRPGGWVVDLPATAARIACAASVLAISFQLAGLDDLDAELIVTAATFLASMDVGPVRLGRQERRLADRLRQNELAGTPISAATARRALPKSTRRNVSVDEVAQALDRLVDAGLADRDSDEEWTVRAEGSEAWIRFRLSSGE